MIIFFQRLAMQDKYIPVFERYDLQRTMECHDDAEQARSVRNEYSLIFCVAYHASFIFKKRGVLSKGSKRSEAQKVRLL